MSEPQVEGKTVHCRLLERRDVGEVCKLMEQFRHPIWGLTARSLYRVLCNDALARQHVFVVVTEEQGIVVGFLIAMRDWKRYWWKFLIRHPFIGSRAVVGKLLKVVKRPKRTNHPHQAQESGPTSTEPSPGPRPSRVLWDTCSPSTAIGVFMGVLTRCRGRGYGPDMYRYLCRILAERGVECVAAHVDAGNAAPLRMHQKLGWQIEPYDNGYWLCIDPSKSK